MDIKSQEEQIRAMLEETATDSSGESSSEQETDHCSEHEMNSDTEQEGDDSVDVSPNSREEEAVVFTTAQSGNDPEDDLPLSLLSQRVSASRQISGPFYKSKDIPSGIKIISVQT